MELSPAMAELLSVAGAREVQWAAIHRRPVTGRFCRIDRPTSNGRPHLFRSHFDRCRQLIGAAPASSVHRLERSTSVKPSLLVVIGLAVFCGFLIAADEKPAAAPALAKPDQATLAAFEQFKQLEGAWEGKSTKGWIEKANYRPIAK